MKVRYQYRIYPTPQQVKGLNQLFGCCRVVYNDALAIVGSVPQGEKWPSNIRKDFLHKTTTQLIHENQVVVLEDLAVKNMLGNRKLARAISQQGWAPHEPCVRPRPTGLMIERSGSSVGGSQPVRSVLIVAFGGARLLYRFVPSSV
uniref:helix-turn-helix domain-containing protein n=1 Tax=Prochlorothrix hollandica TaxID=1223 RepID=UPI000475AB63|nr:helix-turn-helix domain-containing protein [Prochlorothrix hollandica]